MNKPFSPVLVGTTLLLSVATGQAADSVQASCHAGDNTVSLRMDAQGVGSVQAGKGADAFSCALKLETVEGPPFGQSMTGMLVLTFDREDCEPKASSRKLLPEIALHVADPQGAHDSGMTIIHRRPMVFDCQVGGFDLEAVSKLVAPKGPVVVKHPK